MSYSWSKKRISFSAACTYDTGARQHVHVSHVSPLHSLACVLPIITIYSYGVSTIYNSISSDSQIYFKDIPRLVTKTHKRSHKSHSIHKSQIIIQSVIVSRRGDVFTTSFSCVPLYIFVLCSISCHFLTCLSCQILLFMSR